ncbi:MAG: hypothetical protein IJ297_02380 [Clostridia bacterium]|nr:hypothetical protein [Clostridia bacterium]
MKKFICLILTMLLMLSAIPAGAVGVTWSESTLAQGDVTATVTGIEAGDRIAVATYSGGVFSGFNMVWAESDTAEVTVNVKSTDDTARAFVWEQNSMMPKYSDTYLTGSGIMDNATLFSDNQMVNKADAVGYKTITPLVGDYSISFDLTVRTIGDNAIILGDSSNGTIGYGEASAILQFANSTNFQTRRGDGSGSYSEASETICTFTTGNIYHVTIQGNTTTNTYNVIIDDGINQYISSTMTARKDATAAGIDTIAFVNNSKNTVVAEGYYTNYNFSATNFEIVNGETVEIPKYEYTGFAGMYYGLEVVSTGKYVRGNNGKLTADYTSASDTSAMFLPRDMGDGSHAFVCKSSNNRMTTTGTSGEDLTSSAYVMTDNTQHWVLEENENYSETNKTYYFKHIDSSNYIGLSGTNLALVASSNKKEIRLVPVAGESLLAQVSKTDAYNLLSSAQRERIESVYESVAGDVFGRYGGTAEWTPRIRLDNMFTEILSGSLTEAEQLSKLEEFVTASANGYIYDGQASYQTISTSLPGTEGLYWEQDAGTAGNYDFWSGTYLDGMLYKYTIYEADGTAQQTINLYVEDQSTAQTNAATFREVLLNIPYEFRQHLTTAKIRNDGANYYNGGGGTLYIRINWTPDANNMRSTVVHELGHILDQACGTWSNGSGWAAAKSADMYSASGYANSSNAEDFAEFCRMYFAAYGNPDMQKGLQVIMPERYASFGRLRQNNLGGWGLWEDEYTN